MNRNIKTRREKTRRKKTRSRVSVGVIAAVCLILVIGTIVAAKFWLDAGHDMAASHDAFEVRVVAKDNAGTVYGQQNGVITIPKPGTAGTEIPLKIELYYKGESYTALRLMMIEKWYGTYDTAVNDSTRVSGILPERRTKLTLNQTIPMADNRAVDGYIYLNQYQTTLTAAEVDTEWEEQEKLLSCRADGEPLYSQDAQGNFVENENGEWRKYELLATAVVPELTDEADGVYSAEADSLQLYLRAEGAQFNRYQEFWKIEKIPARTNQTNAGNGGGA